MGCARKQGTIDGLCLIVLPQRRVEFREIELHRRIRGSQLRSRFQLCDRVVVFALGYEHASEFDVRSGVVGMSRDQLAQILFGFGELAAAQVNVGQSGQRIRTGIERQRFLVFFHRIGVLLLFLKKQAGGEMRLRIFRLQSCSLMVGIQCLVRAWLASRTCASDSQARA